jgi:uncharacterized protein
MSTSSPMNAPSSPMGTPEAYSERGADLPRDYGVTRLVLLPRDPQWMHAYWEVAPYTWEEAERNFGSDIRQSGKPILRLHPSRRHDGVKPVDVPVQLEARNWYIRSTAQGGTWYAELGLLLPDGRFVLLAISNEIQLPAGSVSEVLDEKWGLLKAEWERLYELSGGGRLGVGSLDVAKMLAQRWELLRGISSWPRGVGGVSSWPTSPGVSSWARPQEAAKSFWLVADCELIVYGATEPDAKVRFQGRDITLNPDGTFSVRLGLPDGKLEIPIEARNRDGDMEKSVTFRVSRETERKD